jgi:hypothetical protein
VATSATECRRGSGVAWPFETDDLVIVGGPFTEGRVKLNPSYPVASEARHALQHTGYEEAGQREGRLAVRPHVVIALAAVAEAGRSKVELTR